MGGYLLAVFTLACVAASNGSSQEACWDEILTASCNPSEVIVMKSAIYGRMKLGRCIERDFGFLGCHADALQLMDSVCSGMKSCHYRVDRKSPDLLSLSQCPNGLISYIDAMYDCVKVDVATQSYCSSATQLSIESSAGVLSSDVTDTSRCGAPGSPWIFTASPGQKLNVSLLDFGWSVSDNANVTPSECEAYGYVVERALGVNKTICGGGKRQHHVHLSASNKVEIVLLPKNTRSKKSAFLLTYNAIGCVDLNPPAHAWYKREEDSARIGCEWNHNSWHLACEGNSWSGVVGNCSAPEPDDVPVKHDSKVALSPLLSIALIIGLGVLALTLVCILLIGCIYYKRRSVRRPPLAPDPSKCGTMIEQHTLMRRYQPGQGVPGMADNPSGAPCGPPTQQPYSVRCGTGPHGMTASRAPPQPWDRSIPNPRGGPPTWAAGPQPDYSCPRPRGGQGGTLIKDKDKELDTSDSGSDYYWAGTHKYHVLDKDKPDWTL